MSACRQVLPGPVLRAVARTILLAFFLSLAVALLPSTTASAAGCTALIAHRGVHGDGIDENTVEAITASAAVGSAEIDVHVSADRHLIVMHDATVDRTTDGTGYVRDLTIDQVRQLRTTPSGDQVPTLWRALRAAAAVRLQIVVELKLPSQWTPDLYARLDRFSQRFTDRGATIYFGGKGRAFEVAIPTFAPHVLIYWRPVSGEPATVSNAASHDATMVMDFVSRWTKDQVTTLRVAGFVTAARNTQRLRLASELGLDYALTERITGC
jgi:hypothetical protein